MRWFSRSLLLCAALSGLVLFSGVAHASIHLPAPSPAPGGLAGQALVGGLAPAAATPTPTSTCDVNADPQTCADAFLAPADRPFQVAIAVILGLIGGGCLLASLLSIARGVSGGLLGEPRWVSRGLLGFGGAVFLFLAALILVNAFGNIHGLVPTPSLPHLGG
jgi:hypothetical protein